MITQTFEEGAIGNHLWKIARMGKITGSKVKGVLTLKGSAKKVGYYELIAERIAAPEQGDLSPMERGNILEPEALDRFQAETGLVVSRTKTLWIHDEHPNIAMSPDGIISETEACEVKCLNSARHVEALLTQEVPDDYWGQMLQYFIVNEKLETLYFIFFDPRMTIKEFFYLTIKREDVQINVDAYLKLEVEVLKEVDEIVSKLSDF